MEGKLLVTFVFIIAIQNLRLEEVEHGVIKRSAMQDIKANIHDLINLIGFEAARQALDLALQSATEDVLDDRGGGVMASVNDIAEELVGVLLAAAAEMLGVDSERALDVPRHVQGLVEAERPDDLLLQHAERAITTGGRIAERRVLLSEAEISERRRVSQALKNAVEIARVAQIPQT